MTKPELERYLVLLDRFEQYEYAAEEAVAHIEVFNDIRDEELTRENTRSYGFSGSRERQRGKCLLSSGFWGMFWKVVSRRRAEGVTIVLHND